MPAPAKCIRCHAVLNAAPYLMAGRPYCCQSCSVGSACEHQGIHRAANVRRYDSMFDRFAKALEDTATWLKREGHFSTAA